jgi:hypothetical protein
MQLSIESFQSTRHNIEVTGTPKLRHRLNDKTPVAAGLKTRIKNGNNASVIMGPQKTSRSLRHHERCPSYAHLEKALASLPISILGQGLDYRIFWMRERNFIDDDQTT